MNLEVAPSRFEPRLVARPWGARRLDPLFPEMTDLVEPVGEVWLTGEQCRLATGAFAGRPLSSAWPAMPMEWRGNHAGRDAVFPLLVKFVFPEQALSVQVHPDDDYAARHELAAGGRGKTEMWHAVAARPGAEVLVGLAPGANPESVRQAIATDTIERHIRRIPVAGGDTIFVPAGTVHAIPPGVMLCEIQQQSDLTYRIYDYNRLGADGNPRALHRDKALDVIRFGPSPAGKTRPVICRRGSLSVAYLAACRYFAAERWEFAEPVEACTCAEHFHVLIFLVGEGCLAAGASRQSYRRGEAWFLPASLGGYMLEPGAATTLIRAYVPDLDVFERRLLSEGVLREQVAGILFR